MQYRILYDYDQEILKQIAKMHYDSLKHLSFLTLFGQEFLVQIYKLILVHNLGFFSIAYKENEIFGFALLSFDNTKLMPTLLKHPWRFMFLSIPAICKHPKILSKIIRTLFYFNDTKSDTAHIKPEFLAQVTKPGEISKGIGTQVIKNFESEYARKGIEQYKFAIAQSNMDSANFFERRGFTVMRIYNFSGTMWNIYVKCLNIDLPSNE